MSSILINKDWNDAIVESIFNSRTIEEAENKLIELGFQQEMYGIEEIEVCGRILKYINRGDTYDITICSENGKLFADTWGDWVEEAENK